MNLIHERYKNKIQGMISCFDHIILTGTFPRFCYPEFRT